MEFLRPEIKRWLYKWKESLISLIIALTGLRLTFYGFSTYNLVLQFLGSTIVLMGICVIIVSYRRISFSQFPNGVGLIEVKERQIIYFDPSGGLAFSADNIVSIEVRKSYIFGSIWRLQTEDASIVEIPFNALGNEKLFDVFMTLPKIDQTYLINAANNPQKMTKKIWSK